jgi:acetyltransferase-like isoleucine patch superfamily enzyme
MASQATQPKTPPVTSHSKDVPNFYYTKQLVDHPQIEVGEYTYGAPKIMWLHDKNTKVTIGKFCSIASDVVMYAGGNHRVDFISTYPFASLPSDWPGAQGETPVSKGNIHIGNDVWLGIGARILSGVTIGHGAVIGAHALVAKDVPPYGIAVGNPARVTKKRFDDKTIQRLLDLAWWDWDSEKIKRNVHIISSGNIEALFTCS